MNNFEKLSEFKNCIIVCCILILSVCAVCVACTEKRTEDSVKPQTTSDSSNASDAIENTDGASNDETTDVTVDNTGSADSSKPTSGNNTASKPTATPNATSSVSTQKPSATATPDTIAPGEVVFSKAPGFYKANSASMTLTAAAGYDIYYTMDCSDPITSSTAKKYLKTFRMQDKSNTDGSKDCVTVIKAVAVKNGTKPSSSDVVYTNTYILNNSAADFSDRYGKLGVFSISMDSELLFGSDGIYTNYTQHGRETERKATIEFFEAGGTCEISMDAGIRIYGGTSRGLPQKSLKVVARKEYSENGKFKYAFFPDNKDKDGNVIKKYDSFVLRAGGNDSVLSGDRSTALRDALAHKLAKNIDNVSSQDARPVAVYLNGQYWGIYFLREDLDNDYVEAHYGVPKDNVSILAYGHENGQWFYKVDEGTDADISDYRNMLSYIATHDMANAKYYKEACKMLDTDNFIKYMCINMYLNNRDWPQNNVRMWKYSGTYDSANKYTDGKWRFMLKDIDFSMNRYVGGNGAEPVTPEQTAHNITVLTGGETEIAAALSSLLKNNLFRAEFTRIMKNVMNEYYSYDTAAAQIDKFVSLITDEMQYHMTCTWGGRGKVPLTKARWTQNVDILKTYFRRRGQYVQNLIDSYL